MRRTHLRVPTVTAVLVLGLAACSQSGGAGRGEALGDALGTVASAALDDAAATLRFSDAAAVEEAYGEADDADAAQRWMLASFGLHEAAVSGRGGLAPFVADAAQEPFPTGAVDRALSVDAPGRPFTVLLGVEADWSRTAEVLGEAGWSEDEDRMVAPDGPPDLQAPLGTGIAVAGADEDVRILAADVEQYDTWYGEGSLLDDEATAALADCLGDVAVASLVPRFGEAPSRGPVSDDGAVVAADDVEAAAWGISLDDPAEPQAVLCLVPTGDPGEVADAYEDAWGDLVDPLRSAPVEEAFALAEAGTAGDAVRLLLGAGRGETDVQRAQMLMSPMTAGWFPGVGG